MVSNGSLLIATTLDSSKVGPGKFLTYVHALLYALMLMNLHLLGSQAAGGNGNLIAVVGGICGSSVAPCN